MRRRSWVLLTAAAVLLVGPFLVPVNSSGSETNDSLVTSGTLIQTGEYRTHLVTLPQQQQQQQSEVVLILLHGFGASSASWDAVLEPLSQFGEVVAYDRPAFGLTDRPTAWQQQNPYSSSGALSQLSQVIEKYAPEGKQVYLVGHSAGAMVATQFALDNPGKVSGLILVAPAILAGGGAPSWLNWLFYVPQIDHLGPLLVSEIAQSGLQILEDSYFNPSLITDDTLAKYQLPLRVAGWERAFWQFNRAERNYDAGTRLTQLAIPVLVITGDSDKIVDPSDSTEVSGQVPRAKLIVLPNLGHLPHEENPDSFIAAIEANWNWLSD